MFVDSFADETFQPHPYGQAYDPEGTHVLMSQ